MPDLCKLWKEYPLVSWPSFLKTNLKLYLTLELVKGIHVPWVFVWNKGEILTEGTIDNRTLKTMTRQT